MSDSKLEENDCTHYCTMEAKCTRCGKLFKLDDPRQERAEYNYEFFCSQKCYHATLELEADEENIAYFGYPLYDD
jgi:endogenous inhibitor of DNA gyrase (YacG/DUF329 family)